MGREAQLIHQSGDLSSQAVEALGETGFCQLVAHRATGELALKGATQLVDGASVVRVLEVSVVG
jgi:hypothetical protein